MKGMEERPGMNEVNLRFALWRFLLVGRAWKIDAIKGEAVCPLR